MIRGIDVSENNGTVDWKAVKDNGIEFAIIRLGYGNRHLDSKFLENISEARKNGLKVGVYYYDYGLTVEDAKAQAQFLLEILKGYGYTPWHLEMGVWYDMEDADDWKARHGMPSGQTLTDMCSAFIVECNKEGHYCGIYASLDWFINKIDTTQYADYVPYWVAQWGNRLDFDRATLWQYTEKLNINGKIFDGNYLMD